MEGAKFLEERYKLNSNPAVEDAALHSKRITGESVPQNYNSRIENYFNRLDHIINPPLIEGHSDFDRNQRNIRMLKPAIMNSFVTKFEDIPESFWNSQVRILRERGQLGDFKNFSNEEKNKWKKGLTEGLIEDQKASLEQWVDYLASPDLKEVPSYVKYWVFRSVIGLSEYDKEKHEYPQRSKGTVKMFPDINSEALAYVMDALLKQHRDLPLSFDIFDEYLPEDQKKSLIEKFKKGLETENFAKLYAWANEQIKPIPERELPITNGKWIKYEQGSDHKPLVASIRGKGTGWCTAGESFAMNQLEGGDFYVYYSNDDNGNSINPRIAIRMEGHRIFEIRGIASKQNLDPYIGDVLKKKLDEFPDKEQYLKKEQDMKHLTEIDRKTNDGEELSRGDLRFLYEQDGKIEGFGYEKDPRIKEIRLRRKASEDFQQIFDLQPEQVADSKENINPNTKAYLGKLFPGIFDQLPKDIEYIYTSFPDKQIITQVLRIGGLNSEQLQEGLNKAGNVSDTVTSMIISPIFDVEVEQAEVNLVYLRPVDLGINKWEKTNKIFAKARKLGLELCPPEVGPQFVIQGVIPLVPQDDPVDEDEQIETYKDPDTDVIIAMQPIMLPMPSFSKLFNADKVFFEVNKNNLRGVSTLEDGWDPLTTFVFKIK